MEDTRSGCGRKWMDSLAPPEGDGPPVLEADDEEYHWRELIVMSEMEPRRATRSDSSKDRKAKDSKDRLNFSSAQVQTLVVIANHSLWFHPQSGDEHIRRAERHNIWPKYDASRDAREESRIGQPIDLGPGGYQEVMKDIAEMSAWIKLYQVLSGRCEDYPDCG